MHELKNVQRRPGNGRLSGRFRAPASSPNLASPMSLRVCVARISAAPMSIEGALGRSMDEPFPRAIASGRGPRGSPGGRDAGPGGRALDLARGPAGLDIRNGPASLRRRRRPRPMDGAFPGLPSAPRAGQAAESPEIVVAG